MASTSYLNKKRRELSERNSRRGKYGNEVKRRIMHERGNDGIVVGGFETWGNMGEHTIELIDCGDESMLWIRVDGELKMPRTMRGVRAVITKWICK